MKKYVIAIDGPSGAGKSTIAKRVAKALGYLYIDSGAMYRAVTLCVLRTKTDIKSEANLKICAKRSKLDFKWDKEGRTLLTFLDGEDVSEEIRSKEVDAHVSFVAKVPGVRSILVAQQKILGRIGGVVMDGRDIGTVVFPKADFKFYLDASIKERALRRYKELKDKGSRLSLKEIEKDLIRRDTIDSQRAHSPLTKAMDAITIDSTSLTIDEVVKTILNKIENF